MATSIMVVSSGFYDDVRVRKMASSVRQFKSVDHVVVLASRRPLPQHEDMRPDEGHVQVLRVGPAVPEQARRWRKLIGRAWFLASAAVNAQRRSARGDVIHCHDLDVALIGMILKSARRRFILDCHEIYPDRFGVRGSVKWVLRLYERLAVRRCDLLVSVSDSARDYLVHAYGQRSSVVVTNSRSASQIRRSVWDESTRAGTRIIYAGRLSPGRGLSELVKAGALLPPAVSITLMGWGPMRRTLQELAARHGGGARVVFRDPVDMESVVDVVAEYDVGAVLTEPIGLNHQLTVSNKIFEYAAAGLPVLMSDIAEHRRLNAKYRFGVICRPTARDVADAIAGLEPDDLRWMRAGALRLARGRAWEREMERLEPLYADSAEDPV